MYGGDFMGNYEMTAVLAGNLNVGKTAIFNGLTGLRQHVGKWAGATMEAVDGEFTYGKKVCLLVDLPGIDSLEAWSPGGEAVRRCLCSGEADVVVVVSDAVCMERGLYLLKEILSLETVRDQGIPVVLCVNWRDEAERRGIWIDFDLLRDVLQFPVVSCSTGNREELTHLKEAILECSGVRACYDCLDFSPGRLARETVRRVRDDCRGRERWAGRTGAAQFWESLLMVVLLMAVFWLTMTGAVCPSGILRELLSSLEDKLAACLSAVRLPDLLVQAMVCGVYRAFSWVVSVMLPPAVIFFPLFTMLEDSGCLPRLAFRVDGSFRRCRGCGRQCVAMAMGVGCNVAGVMDCRNIHSPRERMLAILTNSLAPCCGRFPTLFLLITLFLLPGLQGEAARSLMAAFLLTAVVVAGVLAAMACSWLLSHTFLKNVPSAFTLELPPRRRPQMRTILVRALGGRALFVIGRAAAAAVPAGLLVWFLSAWSVGGRSALFYLTDFLDPAGRLIGLDGVILAAFLLGFPANEMVIPIMLTAYLQSGYLVNPADSASLQTLLADSGWTWRTALCMAVFCVFHWPCLPACLAVRRETGSMKWTVLAIAVPTLLGVLLCAAVNGMGNL